MERLAFEPFVVANHPDTSAFVLSGAVGCENATLETLHAWLRAVQASGKRRVVLEASQLRYLNDTGLGTFVKAADTLKKEGGAVALYGAPAKVKIVCDVLGLDAFFAVCEELEDALASVHDNPAWRLEDGERRRRRSSRRAAEALARALAEGWSERTPSWIRSWLRPRAEVAPSLRIERLGADDESLLVSLAGPADERAPSVWRSARPRLATSRRVVLDLSRLGPVELPGLSWLVAFATEWCTRDRRLVLVGLPAATVLAVQRARALEGARGLLEGAPSPRDGEEAALTLHPDLASARRAIDEAMRSPEPAASL